ncbi:hypothetical protein, partial [Enterococcus faecalis]|uniref:hypothetical protein n=1 Tax=Enterococcus faecalis TaxID=1351 RepID=UPI003D6B6DD6
SPDLIDHSLYKVEGRKKRAQIQPISQPDKSYATRCRIAAGSEERLFEFLMEDWKKLLENVKRASRRMPETRITHEHRPSGN